MKHQRLSSCFVKIDIFLWLTAAQCHSHHLIPSAALLHFLAKHDFFPIRCDERHHRDGIERRWMNAKSSWCNKIALWFVCTWWDSAAKLYIFSFAIATPRLSGKNGKSENLQSAVEVWRRKIGSSVNWWDKHICFYVSPKTRGKHLIICSDAAGCCSEWTDAIGGINNKFECQREISKKRQKMYEIT